MASRRKELKNRVKKDYVKQEVISEKREKKKGVPFQVKEVVHEEEQVDFSYKCD